MVSKVAMVYGFIVLALVFLTVWLIYYFWKLQNPSGADRRMSVNAAQSGGKENREHRRTDINWPVSLETPDGLVAAQIRNISAGGAFICCQKPLPIGEMFSLTITASDSEPMKATAKVVWSNASVPDNKVINRGMGVRFINMSEKHIRLVRETCQGNG